MDVLSIIHRILCGLISCISLILNITANFMQLYAIFLIRCVIVMAFAANNCLAYHLLLSDIYIPPYKNRLCSHRLPGNNIDMCHVIWMFVLLSCLIGYGVFIENYPKNLNLFFLLQELRKFSKYYKHVIFVNKWIISTLQLKN
jgi:hypothetical protein